jgi:hypothetical protein
MAVKTLVISKSLHTVLKTMSSQKEKDLGVLTESLLRDALKREGIDVPYEDEV